MAVWNGIELNDLTLHSARLTLRAWRPDDAAAVTAIMADPRMAEFLPLPTPYRRSDAVDFVTGYAAGGRGTGSRLECALVETGTGRLIGAAGLHLPVGRVEPEIGYWIASSEWGRGFASEAVRTLTDFGFANDLRRIRIIADVGNIASARVALRSGYRFEGIARRSSVSQAGPADHAVFARLCDDPGEPVPASWPELGELSDGVVTLRRTRADDWPTVLAEASNDEAMRWGFGGDALTEQGATERCRDAELRWLVGRAAELTICDARTGAGAGTMVLRTAGPPNVVSIGYGILPQFRGRRFTTRALQLISDWAFDQTPISRLELGCKADNLASARSAELAGFRREARFERRLLNPDGSYSDEIGFGKVRPVG